jgi:hypothetical protein
MAFSEDNFGRNGKYGVFRAGDWNCPRWSVVGTHNTFAVCSGINSFKLFKDEPTW